jgi:hypothetical protein
MVKRYERTQVGYIIIVVIASVMLLLGIVFANAGINWIAIMAMLIIGVVLVLFSSLTVVITEEYLEIRFGYGLIRKRFKLKDIESCQVVRNPWYYGWGIRLTPHGWLYRVSGRDAVEIKIRNGKKYRIGTNTPDELREALMREIS